MQYGSSYTCINQRSPTLVSVPRHITPELMAMLADTRATSAAAHRATLDEARALADSGHLLQAIAWRSGPPELEPFDPGLRDLIDRARQARHTWVEIAVACGDTPDAAGAARTQARQRWRHQQG